MIDHKLIEGFKTQYSHVHPLIFLRSYERAGTPGELFDILESIPEFPLEWDESIRRWKTTDDILHSREFIADID